MQDAKRTLLDGGIEGGNHFDLKHAAGPVRAGIVAAALACVSAVAAAGVGDGADRRPESSSAETIVRMYPTAVVAAARVTLADLAEVEGEVAELAAKWPIAQAPKAGRSRIVDLNHVQKVLVGRGANLGRWVFRGSTRCTVTRPVASGTGRSGVPGALQKLRSKPGENHAGAAPASNGATADTSTRIDPNTLGGALHEHISKRLANIGGLPLIEFTPAVTRLLGLSKATYEFEVRDRSDRLLGLVPFEVTILEKNQVKQVLQVIAKVSLRKQVVVGARQINRGETIGPNDLALEDRVFHRIEEIGLTETGPLIGQRAKRFIREADQVCSRDIEPVPLVRRNDLVTVIVRRGSLMIRGSARALSGGGYGDTVELKNEMAKRNAGVFTAIVTGHKTAEIPSRDREPGRAPAPTKEDL